VSGALPNLLIIGSAKSGTTSLHRYLALHPDVFMSHDKELKLFERDDWRERLGWYRAQFATSVAVRGESSPTYSMDPWFPRVPERIHEVMPDAKLIYLVRDPIERLVAQWSEMAHLRQERRPLNDALSGFDAPGHPLVAPSRYAHQLERYAEHFDDAQILVVDQHDLLAERGQTLRTVFEFVGVDPDFTTPAFEHEHNTRSRKDWRLTRTAVRLHKRGVLVPAREATRRLPTALRDRLKPLVTEPLPEASLDPRLRAELQDHLAGDADRLRARTGMPLEHWSV
jgi:Sulfotransferase family